MSGVHRWKDIKRKQCDKMAVAVLGGAGFIGSNLVDKLLAQGFEVTVLDNFSEGKRENLVKHPNLEIVNGDIRDYNIVRRVVDHKDWVFHLAAMSRIQPSITDPLLAFEQNITGTANVLEACRDAGVKRVVYSASSSAYGKINEPPLMEEYETDCLNPYSLSKKVGEELMKLYNDLYGLSTVSLRYFNVYGPKHQEEGDYATVIAIFMRQLRHGKPLTVVGNGEQRRDFTFVTDVVEANILAGMNRDVTGVINIGTGVNHSINEVAYLCARVKHGDTVGDVDLKYLPPRLGEAQITLAAVEKAKNLLGWQPTISLEEGLAITHEFQKRTAIIVGV